MSTARKILVREIDEALVETEASSFFDKQPGEFSGKMLEVPEAAKFLGWTEKTLRIRVSRGEVPFYRIGRRVYFTIALLIKWREEHLVHARNSPIPLLNRRI